MPRSATVHVADPAQYKRQFEQFEKQADQLAMEAAELKSKIEREREEAVRLATSQY